VLSSRGQASVFQRLTFVPNRHSRL
jgi:hypothetical protein